MTTTTRGTVQVLRPLNLPESDDTLTGDDSRYGTICVSAWHDLHPRLLHRGHWVNFDGEHTFRFAKNTLGWTAPLVCTPEHADRWTALVVAVLTQRRLARQLVAPRPNQAVELTVCTAR